MICLVLCIVLMIPTVSALNDTGNGTEEDYTQYTILQGTITNLEFEQIEGNQYQVFYTVECEGDTLTHDFICDLYKFGTFDMLTYNKTIGDIVSSEREILNFSLCPQNDVLHPEYSIQVGQALVKLAFIEEAQTAVSAYAIWDASLLPAIDLSFDETAETDDSLAALRKRLKRSETWVSQFSAENLDCEEQQLSEPNAIAGDLFQAEKNRASGSGTHIEYYTYEPNGPFQPINAKSSDNGNIASIASASSSISEGGDWIVNNYFPESYVKSSGCRTNTKADMDGRIYAGYHLDTFYDSPLNKYYTAGAVWNFNYSVGPVYGQPTQRIAEFEFRKTHNFFIYYSVKQDAITVAIASADTTHVITDKTTPSIKLAGKKNYAYIDKYYFEMCEGGTSGEIETSALSMAVTLLGKRFKKLATVSTAFGFLSDAAHMISGYNFNQALKEYEIYQPDGQYAKQIGSTYAPILGKKESALKVRAKLLDVMPAPDGKAEIYFQVQTNVKDCIRTGNEEPIWFYFGQELI